MSVAAGNGPCTGTSPRSGGGTGFGAGSVGGGLLGVGVNGFRFWLAQAADVEDVLPYLQQQRGQRQYSAAGQHE